MALETQGAPRVRMSALSLSMGDAPSVGDTQQHCKPFRRVYGVRGRALFWSQGWRAMWRTYRSWSAPHSMWIGSEFDGFEGLGSGHQLTMPRLPCGGISSLVALRIYGEIGYGVGARTI